MPDFNVEIGAHYSLYRSMRETLAYVPDVGYIALGFQPVLPSGIQQTISDEFGDKIQEINGRYGGVRSFYTVGEHETHRETHSELDLYCKNVDEAEQAYELGQRVIGHLKEKGYEVETRDGLRMVGYSLSLFDN